MFRFITQLIKIFILISFFLYGITNYAQNVDRTSDVIQDIGVIDVHIHNGFAVSGNKIILSNFDYFSQRKVDAFLFPLPVERSRTTDLYLRIKEEIGQLKLLSKESGMFSLPDSFEPGKTSFMNKETKVILCIEYFNGIFGNKLENVDNYYNLGIKAITIVNSETDNLFEGNNLTLFGRELIYRMNKFGILIDISHLSDERKLTIINFSRSPVIASHSNTRKIADVDYNLSEKVVDALREKKGYVFVSFNENDLYKDGNREKDAFNQLVDHIDYLMKTLGADHVGIGSDYQSNGKYVPRSLNEVTAYNKIQEVLLSRGYTYPDVKKIMSESIIGALNRIN